MAPANQLIHETSPYLLQHANNPVNWLPFDTYAFEEAKRLNRPLLISIGYSSCHWCHVMEHESFEDKSIAKLMNAYFVCVKVDREERPDVDHVYMDAVQQINGSGGWPLNCFALPDGRPFWGGTYFRPEQWRHLLNTIHEIFESRYTELEQQAAEISAGVSRQNYLLNEESLPNGVNFDFGEAYNLLHKVFDPEKGGIAGTPKFPMPVVLKFLLNYGRRNGDENALKMLRLTLQKMACGGIYDQVGGGFARYSTDNDWKVPHFEKMLYDNAQLVSLYSQAYQESGLSLYKDIIEQTIEFVIREMTAPEGFFYSALDADSEGEEGLYYTWTAGQFNEILGHYSALAGEYFGVDRQGLWEHGRNILLRPDNDELFAQQHFLSSGELTSLISYCRTQLLKVRLGRPQPALDDKMLLGWNALFIGALSDASVALNREEYLQMAARAAGFVITNLRRMDNGMYHTWKNGQSRINAFLDDYAFMCDAFLKLYSLTADEQWLREAEVAAQYVVDHFYDQDSGFFWYSENEDKQIFARKIETYDGVIPSGNSAMAHVLNTLGIFLHRQDYLEKVKLMLARMKSRLTRYPSAYANWASLALFSVPEAFVVVVIGAGCIPILRELKMKITPGTLIFGSQTKSDLSYFENRYIEGKTLIYICSGSYCLTPVETVDEAIWLIEKLK